MNDYWSAQLWGICELLRELSIVNGCPTDGLESDYSFKVGLSAGQRSRCPGRQIELRLRGGSSKPRCLILTEHFPDTQFSRTIAFWERYMPKGLLLRSPLAGSHLSDPSRSLTLQAYQKKSGKQITAPLPLYRFTDYGRWFQSQAVPDLDCRKVSLVEKNGTGFQLTLEDGEPWKARRVIVAAGIVPFAWHPPEFRHLPFALASHACEHCDLSR